MKTVERIVMLLIVAVFIGGTVWIYLEVQNGQREVREAVERGEYEKPVEEPAEISREEWKTIYPFTVPITIGSTTVEASVADTIPERIEGLSNTPFLPENVVKLFVFDAYGKHSIWMKDMNYPLDIIWVEKEGEIVHIEENISPNTYPESFSSPRPAWFVIEANAGFVENHNITVGDEVVLSDL